MSVMKDVKILTAPNTYETRDIGAEAQYIEVSLDSNGDIIEDITEPGVTVDDTESLTETLIGIQNNVADKVDLDMIGTAETLGGHPSKNYIEGDFLLGSDNNLYKVTDDIATSEYITVNTNVELANIADNLGRDSDKVSAYTADASYWDTTPTASSSKPVTSGGIYTAINNLYQTFSNPNLLDNPWFTVNQRGFTSVSNLNGASKYTVDRWFSYMRSGSVGAVTLNDGEMTISNNSASELLVNIGQNVENDLSGKLLTISVLLHDGTIARGSFIMPSEGGADVTAINEEDFNVYFQHKSGQKCSLGISVPMGSSITIKAVKLELGSVSTLANDTAPNYQQELSKCQRYFQRINLKENYTQIGFFRSGNTTSANGTLYFLTPMRIKPSVQANNISSLSLYMGADIFNVSAISSSSKAVYSGDNAIAIELVATTSGMTNGAVGILAGNHSSGSVNPSIDFSADL